MASCDSCCAVCGSGQLDLHLEVEGGTGPEGLAPTTTRFGAALSDIVRCRDCGHMQLQRMPPEAELAEAYGEAEDLAYVEEEEGQRATADWLLAEVERWARSGSLLDVGCWTGFLLSEAERRGWSAAGVEPSEFAAGYARELGLRVTHGDLFDVKSGGYDAIVMGDVIEHLPEPGAALDHLRTLLAPGGVLALALPDAGSRVARALRSRWWSVIPTHVQYFTRSSLRMLLERHGFRVLRVRTAPKAFTVRYYLGRVAGYGAGFSDLLESGAERLGVADRLWALDFRDRMLVIATPDDQRS